MSVQEIQKTSEKQALSQASKSLDTATSRIVRESANKPNSTDEKLSSSTYKSTDTDLDVEMDQDALDSLDREHKDISNLKDLMAERMVFAKTIVLGITNVLTNLPDSEKKIGDQYIYSKKRVSYTEALMNWMQKALETSQISFTKDLSNEDLSYYITKSNWERSALLSSMLYTLSREKGSAERKRHRDGSLHAFFNYTFSCADKEISQSKSDKSRMRFDIFRDLYDLTMINNPTKNTLETFFRKHTGPLTQVKTEADENNANSSSQADTDQGNTIVPVPEPKSDIPDDDERANANKVSSAEPDRTSHAESATTNKDRQFEGVIPPSDDNTSKQ